LFEVGTLEESDLGLSENRTRGSRSPSLPRSFADDRAAADVSGVLQIEAQFIPDCPKFDPIEFRHVDQATDCSVSFDDLLELGYQSFIVFVNQLSTHTKRNGTLTRPVFEYLEQFYVLLRFDPGSFLTARFLV
jgi:hypothetical protein